jgi:hypothetical protein
MFGTVFAQSSVGSLGLFEMRNLLASAVLILSAPAANAAIYVSISTPATATLTSAENTAHDNAPTISDVLTNGTPITTTTWSPATTLLSVNPNSCLSGYGRGCSTAQSSNGTQSSNPSLNGNEEIEFQVAGSALDYFIELNNWTDWDELPTVQFKDAPAAVPEPASIALFGSGLLGLGFLAYQRRRRRQALVRA